MRIKKTTLIFTLLLPFLYLAGYNLLPIQPDYPAYKFIYEVGTYSEPLFFILNKIFSTSGMPFEIFHILLSSVAFYYFIVNLAMNRVNWIIIILSCLMFYVFQIAAHWRTGLALGFISYLLYKHPGKLRLSLLLASSIHLSALPNLLSLLMSRYLIFVLVFVIIINMFSYEFFILLGPSLFESLGRVSFYENMIAVLSGADANYLHRSIFNHTNLRIYFVLLLIFFFYSDVKKHSSVLINFAFVGCICYLLFLFNAYLAQKSFLLVKPILLAAASKVTNRIYRNIAVTLIILSSFVDIFERYTDINIVAF